MEIIDFSKQNSVLNQYMSELRDKNYQKNRLTFRHNVERIGELMAYEVSKTLEYKPKTVTTPLGSIASCRTAFPSGIPQHLRSCRQCLCVSFPYVYQP